MLAYVRIFQKVEYVCYVSLSLGAHIISLSGYMSWCITCLFSADICNVVLD